LLDADASARGLHGGSGQGFDWSLIPPVMRRRIILSGGLSPDNVGQALSEVSPWGVDVSSGVEQEKGVKSRALIAQFKYTHVT
jgi:phosphoribosylanthranilate isomerase